MWRMKFTGEGAGGAFIDYVPYLFGRGRINNDPRAFCRLEYAGKQPETKPGVLAFIRIPVYGYLAVTIPSFQDGSDYTAPREEYEIYRYLRPVVLRDNR